MAEQVAAEVLFTITKDNLETGMRGYPIGYCTTSSVDPMKGLYYVGKPVSQMTDWQPERVIYLLYHGREGTPDEVNAFAAELHRRAFCSPKVISHIQSLPREGHPMKLFIAALLICGMIEGTGDYYEDALNIVAKIPYLTATVINYHAGWEGVVTNEPLLGYIQNFTQMLNVPNADLNNLEEVFRLFNILHYDHDGGNLSTFIGQGVASGLENMYGSLAAAMCALAGPRHGKANQECLEFVQLMISELGENATPKQVEDYLRVRLGNNELIFGFGHAVLRVEDPRATILYKVAQEHYPHHPLVKMTALLRDVGSKILAENPKISDPYPNVDAISGTVLTAAGFPYSEYYTVLFGMSRCVGIARQIVYERLEARGGKGTPIIRPKYFYRAE